NLLRRKRSAGGWSTCSSTTELLPHEKSDNAKSDDEKKHHDDPQPARSSFRNDWRRGRGEIRLRPCEHSQGSKFNGRNGRDRRGLSAWTSERCSQVTLAPEDVNHRIQQQLQNSRGNDAANHRSGDAFHNVRAALCGRRPHDWEQTEKDCADGHYFGPDALHRPFDNGGVEVIHRVHPSSRTEFVPGVVEVEQHYNARLSVKTRECNEPHPHGDAHVVPQHVEKPERAHEGKRHGQQYDERL